MRTFTDTIEIARPADEVWALVGDIDRYSEFLVGVTRWEPSGPDRWWIHMQVGSTLAGGEVEVTVDEAARELRWETLRGTRHATTVRVEPIADDRSRLVIEFAFRLVGPVAALVELTAAPIVRRNMVASLETARHLVEHEGVGRPEGQP